MNRELKFRVWDAIDNRWIGGENGDLEFVLINNSLRPKAGLVFHQYTGLKDKNGKEIYEGDIVKCHRLRFLNEHRKDIDFSKLPWPENHWYDFVEIGQIRWADINCGFVEDYEHLRYDDIGPLSGGTEHRYEVIGNIFENPELLK